MFNFLGGYELSEVLFLSTGGKFILLLIPLYWVGKFAFHEGKGVLYVSMIRISMQRAPGISFQLLKYTSALSPLLSP